MNDEAREQPTTSDGREPDPTTIPVGNLPVEVVFVAGRLRLPLEEFMALRPGQILDLPRTVSTPIEITVGGALVGAGQLVTVDDRVGVKLLELGAEPGSSDPP